MSFPHSDPQSIIDVHIGTMIRDNCVILRDICWRVLPGEHWALLGPNGSGKSSLLKLVTGYEWPSTGSRHVLGQEYGRVDLRELRKAIGFVSSSLADQLHARDDALSVAVSGYDASIGLWRTFSDAEYEGARRALRAIGAERCTDKPYRVLSQGERQRVMIARALVHRPALLVLDEPCAGLDPVARESFLLDLERLARTQGAPTIIVVTHHVEEIPPFVGHTLLLKDGTTFAAGPIDEVCTADKLGEAFGCRCEVERAGRRWRLQVLELGEVHAR